ATELVLVEDTLGHLRQAGDAVPLDAKRAQPLPHAAGVRVQLVDLSAVGERHLVYALRNEAAPVVHGDAGRGVGNVLPVQVDEHDRLRLVVRTSVENGTGWAGRQSVRSMVVSTRPPLNTRVSPVDSETTNATHLVARVIPAAARCRVPRPDGTAPTGAMGSR